MTPKQLAERALDRLIPSHFTHQDFIAVARAYLEVVAKLNERDQVRLWNEQLKSENTTLIAKLEMANETIHGEFCGSDGCHPLHTEIKEDTSK